jgi:hypothetical protein
MSTILSFTADNARVVNFFTCLETVCNYGYYLAVFIFDIISVPFPILRHRLPKVKDI